MDVEASGDGSRYGPEDRSWVTVAEAARRLRVSPRAIRGRIRRGTIEWKAAGNVGKLVQLPSGDVSPDDPVDDQDDELALLREELIEARVAQARAEERATAKEQVIAELKAMLAEARKPWWRRWIG